MKKSKIKILYVITRFICGGAQKVVLSLATNLDEEKYETTVACGELPESEKDCASLLADKRIKLVIIRQLVRDISIINDLIALLKLFILIKKGDFDIVHTFTSKAGTLGRLAAFFAGTPVIIYSPLGNIYEPKGNIAGVSDSPLARLIFLFLDRVAARFTDKIITISEDEKSKYIKLRIEELDKFVTIYEGIDYNKFLSSQINAQKEDFGFGNNDVIIGSVGRLASEKGHLYLIEAAVIILKVIPQAKFLIIGDGPYRKKLEDYAGNLGITESVRFLGLRKDIPQLLSIMDVFVLPSLYEGQGIAVVEAMAMALPVVATRVGGVVEVIIDGETGILVLPGTSKAIADAAAFLLKNKEKAKSMGRDARLRVERYFGVDLMVKKIENLYNELLIKKF